MPYAVKRLSVSPNGMLRFLGIPMMCPHPKVTILMESYSTNSLRFLALISNGVSKASVALGNNLAPSLVV